MGTESAIGCLVFSLALTFFVAMIKAIQVAASLFGNAQVGKMRNTCEQSFQQEFENKYLTADTLRTFRGGKSGYTLFFFELVIWGGGHLKKTTLYYIIWH